ncbi:MAG: putative zinc-binding metallopeptidase [Candidatus Gracilibacteria bacterium]|nr:putative zinc-binding metallopeptidase [Candidatus Gracilibacteria bacterium]
MGTFETDLNNHVEDNYIEPSITTTESLLENSGSIETHDETLIDLNSGKDDNTVIQSSNTTAYKVVFNYFPSDFIDDAFDYTIAFKSFLYSDIINDKIDSLKVEMYKQKGESRGKMKNRRVKLYGVKSMKTPEMTAVGIHEFAHFIDLYYFQKKVFTDISDFFYNISWDGVHVIKSGQKGTDFVSGYAMTNKYEDFAETFTYYILHNKDFLEKTKSSTILKKKYDFFGKYLFRYREFNDTNFSTSTKVLGYYRDITKIDFSLQNFLEFLKK